MPRSPDRVVAYLEVTCHHAVMGRARRDAPAHSSTVGFWGCQSPSVSCVFMVVPRGWFRSSDTRSYLFPAPVPAGPLRRSALPANSAMVS